jgi:hypothetical protein
MALQWFDIQTVRQGGRYKLALDGSVLICRHDAWAESFDSYLPVESLRLWHDARHDFRPLIRGTLLAVCTLLCLASLSLLHETFPQFPDLLRLIPTGPAWLSGILLFAAACLAMFIIYGAYTAFRPRPSLCITHAMDEDAGRFEFWYRSGEDQGLDQLVDGLFTLSRTAHESSGYPVSTGYTRQHVRPLRALFLGATAITFMMVFLAHLLKAGYEAYTGESLRVVPHFYGVFLLPWGGGLLLFLMERLRMRMEPVRFRMGLRHYHREEFEKAERRFLDVLRDEPDHVPTLYLLTRLTAHRFDFERAFRFCRQLGRLAPEQAEALQEDIWTLKRLCGRMATYRPSEKPVDAAGSGRVK